MATKSQYDQMLELMQMMYPLRHELVPCLIGPPGIGKTAAVEEHAAKLGVKVVKIIASRCIPSEIVGMTMPDAGTRSMRIYDSWQISTLKDGDILFLDELLEADQVVLSALLTLIESRENASGSKLPDIQIVAATNTTITASQLRDNIKQRFLFKEFRYDEQATRAYIREKTGVVLSNDVLKRIGKSSKSEYNQVTPRTLTKLTDWLVSLDGEQRMAAAVYINSMFDGSLGVALLDCVNKLGPEQQAMQEIRKLCPDTDFGECSSLNDMVELLMADPRWDEFAEKLKAIEVKESKPVF